MVDPVHTPLVQLEALFPGRRIFAKCEFMAPSGSFKAHGARHLLENLKHRSPRPTLVVPSMGNTALGAAHSAKTYGFSMVGVVPQAISKAKDEKLQALGVELIKNAGGGSALLQRATEIAAQRQGYFVHPHLDPLWTDGYLAIAGQILEDEPQCRTLVFPIGGGGLLMGLTEYFRKNPRSIRLIGCEAYNFPTYAAYTHERTKTIADGLILDTPHPQVARRIVEDHVSIHLITDDAIRQAMADLHRAYGWIVEPSSAITIAFIKQHLDQLADPVCAVLTGGNITQADFEEMVRGK